MSSRALKKALAEQMLKDLGDASHEDGDQILPYRPAGPANMFDLLNEEEGEVSDKDEDDSEKEMPEAKESELVPEGPQPPRQSTSRARKTRKGRERRGKGKAGESSADKEVDNLDSDDFDVGSIQLEKTEDGDSGLNSIMDTSTQARAPRASLLLGVQRKYLNVEDELRRMSGFALRKDRSDRGSRHMHGRQHSLRSYWLVQPKANWQPSVRLDVAMEKLEAGAEGTQWFTFVHNRKYREIQANFFAAVASMDHNQIAALLYLYPYHTDSLLQLADVCAVQGDSLQAQELVEKALFAFESRFHHQFSLSNGCSRMDYRRYENRSFFLALFKYSNMMAARGCWRTALEYSKILLSLDESDPLGALLMIDLYALRSKEYTFLVSLYDSMDPSRHLHLLPNFAYSVALAHFYKERTAPPPEGDVIDGSAQTSSKLLQQALMLFPMALRPLATKARIALDSAVEDNDFFAPLVTTPNMNHYERKVHSLSMLYVHRSYLPWQSPEVATWVNANAAAVAQKATNEHADIAMYRDLRVAAYGTQSGSRVVERHIMLSGINEAIGALPPAVTRETMHSYDPLPPSDSISPYEVHRQPTHPTGQPSLSLFLRALLPSFGIEEGIQLANQDENGGITLQMLLDGLNAAGRNVVDAFVGSWGQAEEGNAPQAEEQQQHE